MTKELLLARRTELEGKLAEQRGIQASAQFEIERQTRRAARAHDQENAVGGAIQELNYWGSQLEAAERKQQDARVPEPPAPGKSEE